MSLGVDIAPGQTLTSFVSCLAARNGLASMQRFCTAFDLNGAGIRSGKTDALTKLSEVVGVPLPRLVEAATQKHGDRATLVGERLDREDLATHPRFCSQCLADDHADQPLFQYETAGRYRGAWDHRLVRACARHDLELMPIPVESYPSATRGDFALALRAMVASDKFPPAIHRKASPVETYIQNRLSRQPTQVSFMDQLPLNDAVYLCGYLGTYREPGSELPTAGTNIDTRLRLINLGLSIVGQGRDAVRRQLEDIASTVTPPGVVEVGLRRIFKQLYDRVHADPGEELLAIRQILVEIGIRENIIEFDQTEALGLPLLKRSMPMIEVDGKAISISSRELQAGLARRKFARFAQHALAHNDPRMLEIDALLRSCLNHEEAARTLGLRSQELTDACDQGLVKPCFTLPTRDLRPVQYFHRSDLEKFRDRMVKAKRTYD